MCYTPPMIENTRHTLDDISRVIADTTTEDAHRALSWEDTPGLVRLIEDDSLNSEHTPTNHVRPMAQVLGDASRDARPERRCFYSTEFHPGCDAHASTSWEASLGGSPHRILTAHDRDTEITMAGIRMAIDSEDHELLELARSLDIDPGVNIYYAHSETGWRRWEGIEASSLTARVVDISYPYPTGFMSPTEFFNYSGAIA